MTDRLPRSLSKEVKRLIKELPVPYEVRSSRDHYFLLIPGVDKVCIGNNGSKRPNQGQVKFTAKRINQAVSQYYKNRRQRN